MKTTLRFTFIFCSCVPFSWEKITNHSLMEAHNYHHVDLYYDVAFKARKFSMGKKSLVELDCISVKSVGYWWESVYGSA